MGSVLYYLFLFVFTIPYFAVLCVVFLLTVAFDRERVVLHWASRIWAMAIFRLNPCWKLKLENGGKADGKKPWVVVVNHQSMADIPLMYVLPLKFKWVSKAEVRKWPLFGIVLYFHGDILVERSSGKSVRRMIAKCKKHLDRGTSVIIFPEGTRSPDARMGRFHEGAFLVAKTAGMGILPVVSKGTGTMTDGWRVRMPHTFTVRVLDPVPAEEVAAAGTKEMMARVEEAMKAEYRKMCPELYAESE